MGALATPRVRRLFTASNTTFGYISVVDSSTPTMDKANAWLKEHGQMLEEDIIGEL